MENKRRNNSNMVGILLITTCIAVLAAILALIVLVVMLITVGEPEKTDTTSSDIVSSSSEVVSSEPKREQFVTRGKYTLDAEYTNLLLVNGENPLPENYDYEGALTIIADEYRQPGYDLNQINEKVYPYLQAMCEAAWADGVELKVCSPYRSYSIQQTLFNRQVQKQINKGLSGTAAEDAAATIVARPGTSEHHTGLAIDFIMANDGFEKLPAFTWLQENAADYGFIMRYPKDKTQQTGVIYESWHYRFVGIYEAHEIKESGLCLEEYLEKKK